MYYTFYRILNVNNNFNDNLNDNIIKENKNSIHNNMESNSSSNSNPSKYLEPSKSANPTWQYYLRGALSGMTGILLSHPIDTVKTHIQTGHALRDFKPGIRNFYRGLLAPLAGVSLEKAIVFGTYNYALRKLDNIPLAGAIAGLGAAVVVSPYERVKILRQNNVGFNMKELSVKFLFRGLGATWTREVPGFAIYFSVYENLKHHRHSKHGYEIGYLDSFLYGGISGVIAWIFIYPQDRIKTILQSSRKTENSCNNTGFKSVMLDLYRAGGLRHFYSGFSWAVARAMLLHSGTFCMMEFLNKHF
jgi:solute carrier family 25 carnitine/acylcarnitine transporter 20/29